MKTREELKAEIIEILQDQLQPTNAVTEENVLDVDLGADSLDKVEIVMTIEEKYDVEVNDEEAEKCETVKDVIDLVERIVNGEKEEVKED